MSARVEALGALVERPVNRAVLLDAVIRRYEAGRGPTRDQIGALPWALGLPTGTVLAALIGSPAALARVEAIIPRARRAPVRAGSRDRLLAVLRSLMQRVTP